MWKWIKRTGLGLCLLLILLLLSGSVYEQISRNTFEKKLPEPEGTFVDVGGHELYYEKRGNGSPTVIFESGLPGDHRGWMENMLVISEYGTAISYDRSGYLYSDQGTSEKTLERIGDELYSVLKNEKMEPPYILVGHSAGGLFLRPFVEKHQKEVSGIILLDSSHPDQVTSAPERVKKMIKPPSFVKGPVLKFLNRIGVIRLATKDPYLCLSIQKGGALGELKIMEDKNLELSTQQPFGDIPLTVITAVAEKKYDNMSSDPELNKLMQEHWFNLQKDLATLSSNSKHIFSEEHDHSFQGNQDLLNGEIIEMMTRKDSLRIVEK